MEEEDAGWNGTYALLGVSWVAVAALHVARGKVRDESSVANQISIAVPLPLWWFRLVVILFLLATLALIFADPNLHAWALTRYTVWTFVCSLAYLIESQVKYSKVQVRPVVLCFCVCAELVVGTGYWSFYGSKTYISSQTALSQFHSTVAHMIIQVLLLVELISLAATKEVTRLPFASTLLYLSTYMVTYATAIFSFCHATDSTLPYTIIDPRDQGGYVPLWLLLAWFAHAVFCWVVTAAVGMRNSLADCSTLLSGKKPVESIESFSRISVPVDFLYF
tara:strand:+ start:499 stop:1332 length:834 start_codon:yes stop_codon:yes gene_type:complete